jgi:exodeoxyribonuclease V beta subunit
VTEARARSAGDGSRRLETDAEAVTVVTVHRSKGLEYPLVYLPDAWDRHVNGQDEGRTLALHDDRGAVLDVGGRSGPGRSERFRAAADEDAGENLRLLYVALTRAQCQVVLWWAPSHNTAASALQRFLYRSRTEGAVPAPAYALSGDPSALPGLGAGVVEPLLPRPRASWQASAADPPGMAVRAFRRALDLRWRRTSYSALTAAVHGVDLASPAVGSEAEPLHEDDEAAPAVGTPEAGAPADEVDPRLAAPSPMGELPSGVDFGTAVHSVFELVDPTAPTSRPSCVGRRGWRSGARAEAPSASTRSPAPCCRRS